MTVSTKIWLRWCENWRSFEAKILVFLLASYSLPRVFVSYPGTPLLLEVGPGHNLLRSAVCARLDSLVHEGS
jgi:hypothetical protein